MNSRTGTRFFRLTLVTGFLCAFACSAYLLAQENAFRQLRLARLEDTARAVVDGIDRDLFLRYGDVQALAQSPAAQDPRNWRRAGADNPLVHLMDRAVAAHGMYRISLLVSAEGQVLAVNTKDASGKPIDTGWLYAESFAGAPWLERTLKVDFLKGQDGFTGTVVGAPAISPVVARVSGEDGFVLPFAAPVHDRSGALVGVWVNFASLDLVDRILAAAHRGLAEDGMPSTAFTVLDGKGEVLAHLDRSGSGPLLGRNLAQADGFRPAIEAVRGRHGSLVGPGPGTENEQAVGYAHGRGAYGFPGLGWSVLVQVPIEEAFAKAERATGEMLAALGAGFVLLILCVWGSVRSWQRSRERLADNAREPEGGAEPEAQALPPSQQAADHDEPNALELIQLIDAITDVVTRMARSSVEHAHDRVPPRLPAKGPFILIARGDRFVGRLVNVLEGGACAQVAAPVAAGGRCRVLLAADPVPRDAWILETGPCGKLRFAFEEPLGIPAVRTVA